MRRIAGDDCNFSNWRLVAAVYRQNTGDRTYLKIRYTQAEAPGQQQNELVVGCEKRDDALGARADC